MDARCIRFCVKVVVFSMRDAVQHRDREEMYVGIKRASSCAIIPPREMPIICRVRDGDGGGGDEGEEEEEEEEGSQPMWVRTSRRSKAISLLL